MLVSYSHLQARHICVHTGDVNCFLMACTDKHYFRSGSKNYDNNASISDLKTFRSTWTHSGFCRVHVTSALVFSVMLCVLCLSFVSSCWPWSWMISFRLNDFCQPRLYLRIPFVIFHLINIGSGDVIFVRMIQSTLA